MAWLSNNGFSPTDSLHADDINNLANDIRVWGGNVNGGGYHLSNVIIDNYFPGAGAPLLSPIHVIPTSTDYTSQLRLDSEATGNPARWILIKDASTESGANAGSNFQLVRCNDDGSTIDAPISIVRSTGVITMGAQQWNGNVNGGGFTLSNVVLPGVFTDPTTTKGDLIVHGATTTRLPVGTDGMVLQCDSTQTLGLKWALSPAVQTSFQILTPTGSGLSGGGAMTGSSLSLAADVQTVFGRKGAVVLTAADITGATGVINTRQVLAGAGMSGGGPLTADVTLNANVLSVNGHTGAVVLAQQDITNSGGVPSSRQILPGAGMSGGGTLASDITLNALVTSVFGRTGAVVLTAGDISGATGVLTTRQINTATGSGLAGGGPLSADLSLSVVADTTTQRTVFMNNGSVVGNPRSYMNFKPGPNANVRVTLSDDTANNKMDVAIDATGATGVWHNGVLIANRPAINLIDGSNVTITPSDNSTANSGNGWVDITISSTGGGGGGGGSQSPWTGAIDAANNTLSNVALIGVNRPADTLPVGPSTARIEVQTNSTEAGIRVAQATAAQVAIIEADNDNATAKVSLRAWGSQYGGSLQSTGGLNAGAGPMTFAIAAVEAMRIGTSKNVLIGTSSDDGTHLLQVNGAIKSLSGGVVFPDGSVQTSAAAAGFGDPTTTKGDMIVHSSTGTTRLPVGATNGMVLIADSTSTYGVSWSASAGQTPWTQDIDAAGYALKNAKAIGIGMVPTYAVDIYANPGPAVVRAVSDGNVAGQYAMFLGYSYSGSSANSGVIVQGASARGTQASPAASAAGDALLQLAGFGYTGSAFVQGAGIQMVTGSLFSTSNAQTYISFSTTASGSVTLTERMRILESGNVGIGTTSPAGLLHLSTPSGNTMLRIQTASGSNAPYLDFLGGSQEWVLGSGIGSANDFYLWDQNRTAAVIMAKAGTGNVGIGTSSPQSLLHLVGGASGAIGPVLRMEGAGGAGAGAALVLNTGLLAPGNPDNARIRSSDSGDYGAHLIFENKTPGAAANTLVERMRISSAGNVGIGTASPGTALHVIGSITGWSGGAGANFAMYLGRTGTDGTIAVAAAAGQFAGGAAAGDLVVRSEAQKILVNSGGGVGICVAATNNVGIGTASPSSLLHVLSPSGGANYAVNIDMAYTAIGNYTGIKFSTAAAIKSLAWGGGESCLTFNAQTGANDGSTHEVMRVQGNGSVGIGTSAPLGSLTVAGSYCYFLSNLQGALPGFSGGNIGLALGGNYSNGAAEVDFFNVFTSFGGSGFRFYGMASASAATLFATINTSGLAITGNCNISGQYQVNGVPISGGVTSFANYSSAQRPFGTVFQNNTGKPLFVCASGSYGGGGGVQAKCDASNPPGTIVASYSSSVAGQTFYGTASFWVLPGYYYMISSGPVFLYWVEWN